MSEIYKRYNKWAVRVYFTDKTGKRRSKNKGGFNSKKQAQVYATSLQDEKNKSGISSRKNITFANFFDEWIETYKIGKFSDGVEKRYKHLQQVIFEYFGNTKIDEITRIDYQKFIDEYAKTHAKDTVRHSNSYIRSALRDALDENLLYHDFTLRVVIGGRESKPAELKFLEQDEVAELKKMAFERLSLNYITMYEIAFAIETGCRYGEIVGLTWDCVDFKNGLVNINKTYDYINRTGFKKTKNKQSVRTISVNNGILTALKKLKLDQMEKFFEQGFKNELNLVFINNRHEVPTSNGANKALEKLLLEMNINRFNRDPNLKLANIITMHGLRHTHASYLISNDTDINYVSERLGHSSTNVTYDVYSHLLQNRRTKENEKALELLEKL